MPDKMIVTKSKLDALATSVSQKTGVAAPLTIAGMKTAIDNITVPSGDITISSNGTVNVAQYANAIINVPVDSTPNLQSKTATPTKSQQTITADTGYDGLLSVTVNSIPSSYIIPSGNKQITANGTDIDVAEYATASVSVTPNLQDKYVTPTNQEQVITYDESSSTIIASFPSTDYRTTNINQTIYAKWNLSFSEEPSIGETYHITIHGTRPYRNRTYLFDDDVVWTGYPFTITPTVTPSGFRSEDFIIYS